MFLRQVPRRVTVLAPKGLPVTVQPLSGGRAPEGSSAVPAPSDSGGCKVAPGMEAAFTVTFCPEAEDDFACGLLVVTEREMFEVPVHGVGAAWVAGLVGVLGPDGGLAGKHPHG